MEAALVRALVAEIQGELFFFVVLDEASLLEADVLQSLGTAAEPFVLGHALDQDLFGSGLRIMLGAKAGEESFEVDWFLPSKEMEGSGETVPKIVQRDGLFALGGFGAG